MKNKRTNMNPVLHFEMPAEERKRMHQAGEAANFDTSIFTLPPLGNELCRSEGEGNRHAPCPQERGSLGSFSLRREVAILFLLQGGERRGASLVSHYR